MFSRRIAAHATKFRRRRDSHAAEERAEGHNDSGKQLCRHSSLIELDDLGRRPAFTVFRNESTAAVVSVIDSEIDGENLHFDRVPRFGAFDINWTRQDVAAGSTLIAGNLADDCFQGI